MFTNAEIKQIFYVLKAKYFYGMTTGQSAAILNLKDKRGEMSLWYNLDNDSVSIDYAGSRSIRDRDKFCKMLAEVVRQSVAAKPWLADLLGSSIRDKKEAK